MRRFGSAAIITSCSLVVLTFFFSPTRAEPLGLTFRASVASDGMEATDESDLPSLSADGRYIAFSSYAGNLVNDDTNFTKDVFVHDRVTGLTSRVSIASDGTEGNAASNWPSISGEGRYVAFASNATNLVAADPSLLDIFVHDRQTGETTLVSVSSNGERGNAHSDWPAISADGRFVAFYSDADNLVADDNNGLGDLFVHDRQTGETARASVASDGTEANAAPGSIASLSSNGRYVAFYSGATNLVSDDLNNLGDVFVHDLMSGQTTRVSVASNGAEGNNASSNPSISADGRFVAFASDSTNLVAGDTNGDQDVFVHDRQTGQTTRVSVASDGTQADCVFTACLFGSGSGNPSISADGRMIAFSSLADNLVLNDLNDSTDIFHHDRLTGETTRVSAASDGTEGDGHSDQPTLSADGRYIGFESLAGNLVMDDTNAHKDIFINDRVEEANLTHFSHLPIVNH